MSKHRDDIVRKDIINAANLVLDFIDGFDRIASSTIGKPVPLCSINSR